MNLIDLPELMRERSKHQPDPVLDSSRIDGIEHKVTVARRRHMAGTLATIIAVAVLVISVPLARGSSSGTNTPAHGPSPSAAQTTTNFPEYAQGGRVVATKTASLRDGPLTVTIVPDRLDFTYTNACPEVGPTVEIWLELTVNGHDEGGMTCGATAGEAYGSDDSSYWTTVGMDVGKPAVFTFTPRAYKVTVAGSDDQSDPTPIALPDSTFSVAVLQKVPFDQYPFPPRPAKLSLLNVAAYGLGSSNIRRVDSDPAHPLAPKMLTFTFPDCGKGTPSNCVDVASTSQTPGYLSISIDGIVLDQAEFWDYTGAGSSFSIGPTTAGLHLHAGDQVTITVTPQYVTGAWQFGLAVISPDN
jgi:hypothetical protein